MDRLIREGCAHVSSRWENYGDEIAEARRWAINQAKQLAADEGITLVEQE